MKPLCKGDSVARRPATSADPLGTAEPRPRAGSDVDQHWRAFADYRVERLHQGGNFGGEPVRGDALARFHPDLEGRLTADFVGGYRDAGQVGPVRERCAERLLRHAAADSDVAGHFTRVLL